MSHERPMTAAEFMASLQGDAEYSRRESEKAKVREKRQQDIDQAFAPALERIHQLGFPGATLQDIVKLHSPLPDLVVNILLQSLPTLRHPRLAESVVRALGAAACTFDGRPLVQAFESTSDESLKWAVVNTIVLS